MSHPPEHRPAAADWTFARPARPPFVRLFNWLGTGARRLGWRHRLALDDILDGARRRAGLSDWGDDYFLEPLEILVRSFEQQATLNPFGRVLIRALLTNCVENRLRVSEYARQHPEALETPLASPLMVVGMPRTGTTLLYNLLAQDPAHRYPQHWEVALPCPPPEAATYATDPRIATIDAV